MRKLRLWEETGLVWGPRDGVAEPGPMCGTRLTVSQTWIPIPLAPEPPLPHQRTYWVLRITHNGLPWGPNEVMHVEQCERISVRSAQQRSDNRVVVPQSWGRDDPVKWLDFTCPVGGNHIIISLSISIFSAGGQIYWGQGLSIVFIWMNTL